MELAALCDDLDLYPDEMLGSVASRLGFGEAFQAAVDGRWPDSPPVQAGA